MNAFCGERGWGVSCLFVKSGHSKNNKNPGAPCAAGTRSLEGDDGRLGGYAE